MMRIAIMIAACSTFAACGTSDLAGDPDDDGGSGSGSGGPGADRGCSDALALSPLDPVAGPGTQLHASASIGSLNNPTALWRATRDGVAVPIASSTAGTADIDALLPGVYEIGVTHIVQGMTCSEVRGALNVRAAGALRATYRLRIVAPADVPAPISERRIEVFGGANASTGMLAVETRPAVDLLVRDAAMSVPAYLRLAPDRTPDALVEAYTDASGVASARLPLDSHTVLVVPQGVDVAPRQLHWTSGDLVLDADSVATGKLLGPSGAPLAGARIALTVDGVPATLGTTDASGAFSVRVASAMGNGTLLVEPPAASGLPRLRATGALDLRAPLQICYGANVASVDLAGLQLRSAANAPLPGARVVVVGDVGAVGKAGTACTGSGAALTATGEAYAVAIADADGALPSVRVAKAAALSAVVSAAPGDFALVALDTTKAVPSSIQAPAPLLVTTALAGPSGALEGSVFEATPLGAFARAGATPIQLRADAAGAVAVALAAGGHYDLRLWDPSGRAAPRTVTDVTATTIATSFALPRALRLSGVVSYQASLQLANASVQLLCDECTGIARTRPIAEALTDAAGGFTLAIPDPGTR